MADLTITAVAAAGGTYPAPTYYVSKQANEALSVGDVLRLSNNRWAKADADNTSATRVTALCPNVAVRNAAISAIWKGFVSLTGPTLTPGGIYVVSRTAGKTMPYGDLQNGDNIGLVGIGKTASIMFSGPSGVTNTLTFDGVSPTPSGALSGAPSGDGVINPATIRAGQNLTAGNLIWWDGDTNPRIAYKLGASTTINGSEPHCGIATTNISAQQMGLAHKYGNVEFVGQTIVRGHLYIAGATAGTIVPYTDVQDGWKVRMVGFGIDNNELWIIQNLDTLKYEFTYTAPG